MADLSITRTTRNTTNRKTTWFVIVLSTFFASAAHAQDSAIPRTAQGRPDFNGIWQAINTANYNIEPHAADFSPVVEMGAIGAIRAGLGIVVGGEIPYTP